MFVPINGTCYAIGCVVVFLVTALIVPQPTLGASPATQQTVQRDASAIQFLTQALNAAGGATVLNGVQDLTSSGTMNRNWGATIQQGQVTIKALGLQQYRQDLVLAEGTWSVIVSNGIGELVRPDGTKLPISYGNVVNSGFLIYPLPKVAVAAFDSSIAVIDMGVVQLKTVQARQIRIQRTFPSDPTGTFANLATQDYLFDPTTFQLLETQDRLHPDNTASNAPLTHVVDFGQYQTFSGLAVPTSITETVNGQQTWNIQLTSVNFNSGLTSSDFQF